VLPAPSPYHHHRSTYDTGTWMKETFVSYSSTVSSHDSAKSPAIRKCRNAAICSSGGQSLQS